MNLLARILSHGFALAVVVLIAIMLMYRGDLFPEWDLPEFLVVEDKSGAATDAASGTVKRTLPEAVATSPESTTEVTPVVPQVEVPQVEVPQVEVPQVEAPQVEVTREVVIPDVRQPVEEAVPHSVDEPPGKSPDAAAEDEVAVPEAMLEVPVVAVANSSPAVDTAARYGTSGSTPDASAGIVPQTLDVPGQTETKQAAPSATAAETEITTERLESPLYDVAPSMPAAAPATVTATEIEVVTEQPESSLPDMAPSMSAAAPVTDPQPVPVAAEAPATVTATEIEVVTEQPESSLPDMAPSTPAAAPVTDPQPASVAAEAPATVTATESEVVTEQLESPLSDMAPSMPAAAPVTDPQPVPVPAAATSLEGEAGKSAYESLAAAREAYWLRDYEGAENHYQRLIQLEPDNPDWYGELGNMYFAQGQWQQAAAVYYEAGVRLLNDGKVVEARQMVDVIRGLNGVQADDLEHQINASQVAP